MPAMSIEDLEWKGRAWPAASISGKIKTVLRDARGGSRLGAHMALEIEASGGGREYELRGPAGFWRNFAETQPDDPERVLDFIKRKGCPFGELGPDQPTDTGDWPSVAAWLIPIAQLWGAPGEDGVSLINISDEQRGRITKEIVEAPLFQRGVQSDIWIDESGTLRSKMTARSLAAYMLASAVGFVQLRQPMAICQQCGDWFGLQRAGTKFCSASCRATFSTQRKGTDHGQR
jgi:hypothetical protein